MIVILFVLLQTVLGIEDVAKGRGNFATQIGTYNSRTADLALDGDPDADSSNGHCAQPHGDSEFDYAWWMVDLGSEHAILSVTVYSEKGTSNEVVLGFISVRVGRSSKIKDHTEECALWNNTRFPKDSYQTLECDNVLYGRYVSIQRTAGEHPHNMILCEVLVIGRQIQKSLGLPNDAPTVSSVDASSALVIWKKIVNVTDGLSYYYQYVIEYKEDTSSSWVEWHKRLNHNPSASQYQEHTLVGLKYNTFYDVRVKSYRVLRTREETGATSIATFKTYCTEPSKPRGVSVRDVTEGSKLILKVIWEEPEIVGCDKLELYGIWLRKTTVTTEWTQVNQTSAAPTSYMLKDLDKEDYTIRVVATNDARLSTYAETHYNHQSGVNSDNLGLIVGIVASILVFIALVTVVALMVFGRSMRQKVKAAIAIPTPPASPGPPAAPSHPLTDVDHNGEQHQQQTPNSVHDEENGSTSDTPSLGAIEVGPGEDQAENDYETLKLNGSNPRGAAPITNADFNGEQHHHQQQNPHSTVHNGENKSTTDPQPPDGIEVVPNQPENDYDTLKLPKAQYEGMRRGTNRRETEPVDETMVTADDPEGGHPAVLYQKLQQIQPQETAQGETREDANSLADVTRPDPCVFDVEEEGQYETPVPSGTKQSTPTTNLENGDVLQNQEVGNNFEEEETATGIPALVDSEERERPGSGYEKPVKSSPYQGLGSRSTQDGLKGPVDETAPYVTFVVENEMNPEKLDKRPHSYLDIDSIVRPLPEELQAVT